MQPGENPRERNESRLSRFKSPSKKLQFLSSFNELKNQNSNIKERIFIIFIIHLLKM